jgi:hypothetical protein
MMKMMIGNPSEHTEDEGSRPAVIAQWHVTDG